MLARITARPAALWAVASLSVLPVLFIPLGSYPLVDQDEGRYGSIAAAMVDSGDWVVPRLNGLPYAEKPPALYWIVAASISTLGRSELAVRLPAVVLTCLTALWIGWVAGRAWGPMAGPLSAFVYLATPLVVFLSRAPLPDLPLTLGIAVSLGVRFLQVAGAPPRAAALWFWSGLALAFLSKGPISILLVFATLFVSGGVRLCWRKWTLEIPGALLFLALVAPWFLEVSHRVPGFARFFFWEEHMERFLGSGKRGTHGLGPIDFLLLSLIVVCPWLLWALPRRMTAAADATWRAQRRLLFAWLLTPLAFFTFSSSRLLTYILPAMPALALLVGRELASWQSVGRHPRVAGVAWGCLALGTCALLVGGWASSPWFPFPLTGRVSEMARSLGGLASSLPAGIGVALLGAGWLLRRSSLQGALFLAAVMCVVGGAGCLAAHRLGAFFSTAAIAKILGDKPEADVVNAGRPRPSLQFYLGHPVPHCGSRGELKFGSSFDDERLFIREPADLRRRLEEHGEIHFVCDARWKSILESVLERPLEPRGGAGANQLFRALWSKP